MKKLVFVDSDGTLKNNEGIISEYTRDVIKQLQAKNIEVVITTGRPRYHAIKVKENSNASRYLISSNGAEVYDIKDDKIIYVQHIDIKDVLRISNICKRHKSRFIMTVKDKEVVSDKIKNDNQVLLDMKLKKFLKENQVKQIFIRADYPKDIIKTYNKIKKLKNVKIVNESSFFQTGIPEEKGLCFSIGHKVSNKGQAIKELCEYLNVNLKHTYGFGNDYNDIEMFETVNHSIVMENANADLKEKAKIIAKSNDEQGVAKFLEELFLKKKGE